MFKRGVICFFNILFPPAAVILLTGLNADLILNCVLFLLAVIPSHIHGFYLSWTYFNRKRKVRKGVYPGPPRNMIYISKINNGGASRREVERLRLGKKIETARPGLVSRVSSRLSSHVVGDSPVRPGLVKRVSSRYRSVLEGWEGEAEKYWEDSGYRTPPRRTSDDMAEYVSRRNTRRESRRRRRRHADGGDDDTEYAANVADWSSGTRRWM